MLYAAQVLSCSAAYRPIERKHGHGEQEREGQRTICLLVAPRSGGGGCGGKSVFTVMAGIVATANCPSIKKRDTHMTSAGQPNWSLGILSFDELNAAGGRICCWCHVECSANATHKRHLC